MIYARSQIGKRAVSSSLPGLAPPGGPVATTLCPETTDRAGLSSTAAVTEVVEGDVQRLVST